MNILKSGLLKTIAASEAFVKGMMFDCRTCGQCVLTSTAMVCPMSCPKGLRNGPCGGTIDEKCEVYPDKQCVWVRIYKRSNLRKEGVPILISSPDSNLHHTSSYVNYINGVDRPTRIPLDYLGIKKSAECETHSTLERKLHATAAWFKSTRQLAAHASGEQNQRLKN